MNAIKRIKTNLVGLLLLLASSCTEEQPFTAGNAQVETTFRLKSPSAMQGKITIQNAYLKLSHIQVIGNFEGGSTNIAHAIAPEEPPYQLSRADTSQARFSLSAAVYDQLDYHLFLYQDSYQLVLKAPLPEEVPNPPANDDRTGESGDNNDADGDEGAPESDGNDEDEEGEQGGNRDEDDDDDHDDDDDDDDRDDDSEDDDDDGDDDDGDDDDERKDNDNKGKGEDNKNKNKNKGNKDDDGRTASATDPIVDLEHFFQNAKPAIVVFARYENNNQRVNVIVAVTGMEKLLLRGKQNDSYIITLGAENRAEVSFDPDLWFADITPSHIEAASIQIYQGQPIVFIHKDFNSALYLALVSRLNESADLNFSLADGM